MKLRDALELLQAIKLAQTAKESKMVKFAYALARNKRVLQDVEKDFQNSINGSDDEIILIRDFENARVAALTAAAVHDENGQPIIENGMFKIESQEKVLAKITKNLESKFPKIMEIMQQRNTRINDLTDTDIEVELYKISIRDFPECLENMPTDAMDRIFLLVDE